VRKTATGTALNVKAEPRYWPGIDRQWWENDREGFNLLTMEDCEQHFETLYGDAEPHMQQLVRSSSTTIPWRRATSSSTASCTRASLPCSAAPLS
jgi:hypothetical protein